MELENEKKILAYVLKNGKLGSEFSQLKAYHFHDDRCGHIFAEMGLLNSKNERIMPANITKGLPQDLDFFDFEKLVNELHDIALINKEEAISICEDIMLKSSLNRNISDDFSEESIRVPAVFFKSKYIHVSETYFKIWLYILIKSCRSGRGKCFCTCDELLKIENSYREKERLIDKNHINNLVQELQNYGFIDIAEVSTGMVLTLCDFD